MEPHTLPLPSKDPSDGTHSAMVHKSWKTLQMLIDCKDVSLDGQNLNTSLVLAVAKYKLQPVAIGLSYKSDSQRKIPLYTFHETEFNRTRSGTKWRLTAG